MLVAVDEIRRAPEQILESHELNQQLVLDHVRIEPPQQARSQHSLKRQEQAAIDGPEVQRQRTERGGQSRVQADGAARARRRSSLQFGDFVAAASMRRR